MLRQSVRYTDFDENPAIETLYFNLTKTELADNLDLKDEFERIQREIVDGDQRETTPDEIKQILDLVKRLMRISYGVRSADGKRFIKTDEQWTEFTQTAVFDEFLFSLFNKPENAVAFMTGIMPKDLREAAMQVSRNSDGLVDPEEVKRVLDAQQAQREQAVAAQPETAAAARQVPNVVNLPQNDVPAEPSAQASDPRPNLSNPPTESELRELSAWMTRNP